VKTANRFYKDVTTSEMDGGYGVLLDGRLLKTPGKQPLIVKSFFVAELIATEWGAQKEDIKPETMPITRLANVSIELTPENRDKLGLEARNYAGTDLLCYRASEPIGLAERQVKQWDPLLDWAKARGVNLAVTDTILAIDQSPASLTAAQNYAATHDDLNLTLFVHLIAVFGSTVLAMAVMEGHITGAEAFKYSRLDNLYQIEQWGEDDEAMENAARLETEVIALCQILKSPPL